MLRLRHVINPAIIVISACASRQPEPVRQAVFVMPQPAPAADVDASVAPAPIPPASHARPMEATLPALRLENLRFRDTVECARATCAVDALSPLAPASVATDDGATTLPPAMGWVHVIRPGATVVIPRRATVDLLGVTLTGTTALRRAEAATAAPERAPAWTAFLLPEGGATLRAEGNAPTAVFLVTAAQTPGTAGDVVATATPRSRGGYVLRDLNALDDLSWAGGAMHARVAFDASSSPRASFEVLFASDDAAVAEHDHAGSWELLAALSASGQLHIPAQTVENVTVSERDRTITSGSVAYVPASVRHAWRPDGTHPLIAIQVYSPPGPEQRFRALAQVRLRPP